MPEYLAPGVYVHEVPSANKAIQGASTSTAGMVGVTERGPVGVPTLITSAGAYKRVFGGLLNHADYANGQDALPHAINGFFANGGSRVYVVRVLGTAPASSRAMLQDATPADAVQICASSPGNWGDSLAVTVTHSAKVSTTLDGDVAAAETVITVGSTFGILAGTVLTIGGDTIGVVRVMEGNQVELASPLTASASDGDAVVSEEFDLLIEKIQNGVAFETEIFTGLNLNPDSASYAPSVLGGCDLNGANPSKVGDSVLVRAHVPAAVATAKTRRPGAGYQTLSSGNDKTINDAAITGTVSDDPDKRTGIQALNNEPGISLVAAPGWTSATVQKALLSHCEKQVYRFAVLDMQQGADVGAARDHRSEFDSTRGAIYYPWLTIADPFGAKGVTHSIPPAGHVLGIYARTDNTRGVWKAPANEVVRNVLGFEKAVNKGEQDILNPVHVNCLRDLRSEQRGLRVWGARTLSSNPEWKYVPVRRTFLFIEQSLDAGLQWAVFEPNAKPLWDTVKQSITGFLDSIWRQGGLAGVTQDQAFFVNVGYGITMEQADLDNGRLIVEVGIAPVNPAEFVIIRISQKTLEAEG
ncbi:MAG: phage tail sheath family protein [Alphaproteobacteria bacterium]|jgi:phage tail sheath protein FI|nr:phage tail sheath family protein [Alphaproteobacteria bacterium]